jgi:hypothetical protein
VANRRICRKLGIEAIALSESNARKRAHSKLLAKYPWCIYCAGKAPATTIEHMPPAMMFRGKQRPKGLEFPTCAPCNHGTGHADLVASLVGRFDPDAVAGDKQGQKDFLKLVDAISNNIPGLFNEMQMGTAGQKLARRELVGLPPELDVMRANGPLMTKYMRTFAAKLGFALHYEAFGFPVPEIGAVQPMWFTNVQAAKGELPVQIIEALPPMKTLQQGRKEVSDQFEYSWSMTTEGRHCYYYGTFRSAFAVAAREHHMCRRVSPRLRRRTCHSSASRPWIAPST